MPRSSPSVQPSRRRHVDATGAIRRRKVVGAGIRELTLLEANAVPIGGNFATVRVGSREFRGDVNYSPALRSCWTRSSFAYAPLTNGHRRLLTGAFIGALDKRGEAN